MNHGITWSMIKKDARRKRALRIADKVLTVALSIAVTYMMALSFANAF